MWNGWGSRKILKGFGWATGDNYGYDIVRNDPRYEEKEKYCWLKLCKIHKKLKGNTVVCGTKNSSGFVKGNLIENNMANSII